MNGIELSKRFYEVHGKPMIERDFAEYADRIAVGICGQGSECYGYDDTTSLDHDYQAGFWLWLTREDEERIGFRLLRAYNALPKEFDGVSLQQKNRNNAAKFGVTVIEDFYERTVGLPRPPQSEQEWLCIPDYALSQATNGAVFRDDLGSFSAFRSALLAMPVDVRKKKVAARLAVMAQTGQYNFSRCFLHGEPAAAALCLAKFCEQAVAVAHTLQGSYAPFYKWSLRSLDDLSDTAELKRDLTYLLTAETSSATLPEKQTVVEKVAADLVRRLHALGWSAEASTFLEAQAYAVTEGITSRFLRSLHVFDGVD